MVVLSSAARHESLLALLDGGLRTLARRWFLDDKLLCAEEAALRTVVAPPTVFGPAPLPASFDPAGAGEPLDFAFAPLLFGEALAAGWPWALALGPGPSALRGHRSGTALWTRQGLHHG